MNVFGANGHGVTTIPTLDGTVRSRATTVVKTTAADGLANARIMTMTNPDTRTVPGVLVKTSIAGCMTNRTSVDASRYSGGRLITGGLMSSRRVHGYAAATL